MPPSLQQFHLLLGLSHSSVQASNSKRRRGSGGGGSRKPLQVAPPRPLRTRWSHFNSLTGFRENFVEGLDGVAPHTKRSAVRAVSTLFCAGARKHPVLIAPGCETQSRHRDIRGPIRGGGGDWMQCVAQSQECLADWTTRLISVSRENFV